MIIIYQTDNRDRIEISTKDNITFRIWGTHGDKWREYNATINEAPNIALFAKQFEALAAAMIEDIGKV